MSVMPSDTMTMNIGEKTRTPFSFHHSVRPR